MDLRELDALVAEHVMGLKVDPDFLSRAVNGPSYYDPLAYSTDIAAAWEVVEKIRDDNFSIEENSTHWKARFGVHWAGSLSAPTAICIAALRSKGIDANGWEK